VLAALESEGVPVAAVTVARASLDDVYLRYTGRTFEAAEDGSTPEPATTGGR
jgi:ABC-2 type transport system ATP-binding protein